MNSLLITLTSKGKALNLLKCYVHICQSIKDFENSVLHICGIWKFYNELNFSLIPPTNAMWGNRIVLNSYPSREEVFLNTNDQGCPSFKSRYVLKVKNVL